MYRFYWHENGVLRLQEFADPIAMDQKVHETIDGVSPRVFSFWTAETAEEERRFILIRAERLSASGG